MVGVGGEPAVCPAPRRVVDGREPCALRRGGAEISESQDYKAFATGLAEMARTLLAQESPQDTLDQIVRHAVALVNGCDAAGVLIVQRDRSRTLAGSDARTREIDGVQAELREGPCFDASRDQARVYRIGDMHEAQQRWPRFAARAKSLGVGSMMGFLLYTTDQSNLGALNLYADRRDAFPEDAEHVGWVLASHAAVALSVARQVDNLDHALVSSRQIGEAVGVVMARYRLTADQAFKRLRAASQSSNVKVRDVAAVVTEIGEIPPAAYIRQRVRGRGD